MGGQRDELYAFSGNLPTCY